MKKFVVSVILAIMFAFSFSSCASACACEHYSYMRISTITAIVDLTDYSTDFDDYNLLVTCIDNTGNIWQWYTDDLDWNVGDYAALYIVDYNDTFSDITDDTVEQVSYIAQD